MRIVKAPLDDYPHVCIATGRDDGDMIDTGQFHNINFEFDRVHIYLKKGFVEQMAIQHCGMASREEVDELQRQLNTLKEKLEAYDKLAEAVETMA